MFYSVFKTTNLKSRRAYIGCHVSETPPWSDPFLGASRALQRDVAQEGNAIFRKEVLHVAGSKTEMLAKVRELADAAWCAREDTYNRPRGSPVPKAPGVAKVVRLPRMSEAEWEAIESAARKAQCGVGELLLRLAKDHIAKAPLPRELVKTQVGRMTVRKWKDPVTGKLHDREFD